MDHSSLFRAALTPWRDWPKKLKHKLMELGDGVCSQTADGEEHVIQNVDVAVVLWCCQVRARGASA